MKTRKILALVMAIAIFALSMTVVASAEESERPTSVYTIQNKPNLTYTDADCFNPAGLSISDGSTTVYYDTDSIKSIGKIDFTEFNKTVNTNLLEMCKYNDIDPQRLTAFDNKGRQHHIGIFEQHYNLLNLETHALMHLFFR